MINLLVAIVAKIINGHRAHAGPAL